MYAIGVDYHKAYSHLTILDVAGRVVRAGKIANTADAVREFVGSYGREAEAALEATRNWTVMYDLLEEVVAAVHHDFATLDEARQVIGEFIERYNREWLLERHSHRTPADVRASLTRQAA